MANAEKELELRLREVGGRLGSPPSDVDELLVLLDQIETLLSRVEQSPSQSMSNALRPAMKALVAKALLRHDNMDVRVAVASCISEITRITAPDAPYDDDVMKEVFQRIVESFDKLDDMSCRSYLKRVSILETVAKVRSCVVMLDLECDDLILDMFRNFLKTISSNHPENIFSSMETIMTLVIDESEDISKELVSCLLDSVRKGGKDVLPTSFRLGERVIGNCVEKLKPAFVEFFKPSDIPLNEYSKIVNSLCDESADTAGQNDVSGADDSKQSERTVSDELPQESAKVEEAGHPEEDGATSNKLSRSVVSNGTVTVGNGEPAQEPTSPKEKSGKSRRSGQSKSTLPDNKANSVKLDSVAVKPDNTKKKSSHRPNSSVQLVETKDHSGADGDNETPVVLGRRKGRGTEGDDAPSDGTSGNKVESSAPVGVNKTGDLKTPLKPHNATSDSAPRKGRPPRSKGSSERVGESTEADKPASSGRRRAKAKGQVQDEKFPSRRSDTNKNLEVASDSEGKPSRRSSKKEQLDDKTHGIAITDVEPKAQRKKEKEGLSKKVAEGESSRKRRKINFKQQSEKINSEEDASEDVSLKEMVSPKIALKAFGKDKGNLGESGGSKKKRGHGSEEASASRQKKDLNERLVGSRIKVWWPEDQMFYNGVIQSFDPLLKRHKIAYDDGDIEILRLNKERWELIESDSKKDAGQAEDVLSPDVSAEVLEIKKLKVSGSRPPKPSKEETPSKSGKESSGGQEGDHPKGKGRSKGRSKTVAPSNDNDGFKSSSKSIEKAAIKNKEEKTPKSGTRLRKEGGGEIDAKSNDALSGADETSQPDRISSMIRSRKVTATSTDGTTAGKKRKRRIATPESVDAAKVTVGSSKKAKSKVQDSNVSGKKADSSEKAKSKGQESEGSGKKQESSEKAKSKVQEIEVSGKKADSSEKAKLKGQESEGSGKKQESSEKAKPKVQESEGSGKKQESSEKAKSKVQESEGSGKKQESSEKAKSKVQESEGSGKKQESSEKAKSKVQESEASGKKLDSSEKAKLKVQESEDSGKVDSSEKAKSKVQEIEVSGKLESSEKAKLKVQESEGSGKEDSSEKAKSKVQENERSGKKPESPEKAKLKVQESKGSGKKLDLGSAAAKAQGSETSAGKKRRRMSAT